MADKQPIALNTVITMQYSLANDQGVVIREATSPPVRYLQGCETLFPKLEQALENHRTGDIIAVRLRPDDAFGRRNVELFCQTPLQKFPPGEYIELGQRRGSG